MGREKFVVATRPVQMPDGVYTKGQPRDCTEKEFKDLSKHRSWRVGKKGDREAWAKVQANMQSRDAPTAKVEADSKPPSITKVTLTKIEKRAEKAEVELAASQAEAERQKLIAQELAADGKALEAAAAAVDAKLNSAAAEAASKAEPDKSKKASVKKAPEVDEPVQKDLIS